MSDREHLVAERNSDPVDQGSYLADLHNTMNVTEARLKAAPQQVRNPDGTWPVTVCECGEDIEPQRIEMGRIRCFACQDWLEKRGDRRAG